MFIGDLALFAIVYMIVFVFGYFEEKEGDNWSIMAIVLLIGQGLYIIFYLSFYGYFHLWAISLALAIWIHHMIIHRNTEFKDEITLFTFQINDIKNHETWIVACIVAALTWYVTIETN